MGLGGFIAILAPGLVVFTLPTIGLIARNREFFEGDYAAGRYLYLLSLVVVTLGFALWIGSRWQVFRFSWTCYLLLTPGWLVYSVIGNWNRALASAAVLLSILAIAWLATRSGDNFIRGIELVSVMLLLGVIATTFIETRSNAAEGVVSAEAEPRPAVADVDSPKDELGVDGRVERPNIYHIVMDEYQTEMFELTLDYDLETALAGFTFYPLARTPYGRTEMSMASILGAEDYAYRSTPREFVEESLRGQDSSLEVLRRAGYETTGYSHLASLYGSPSPFDEALLHSDIVDVEPGSDSSELLNSLWLYSNTPSQLSQRFLRQDEYSALAGDNLLPDEAPPISAWSMEEVVDREESLADSGRYSLVHLILPHFPYVLSPSCAYEEGLETSPLEQSACANSLMTSLIEELKRIDRFDASVVVIHGDHGARFQREGDDLRPLEQNFAGEDWNNARSKALLLIKPAGSAADSPLVRSEFPALLTDIMPTVFDSAGVQYEPGDGRTSLLARQLPMRTTRYYHFYDKDLEGLPDGSLTRFVVGSESLEFDKVITLPTESDG